MLKRDPDPTVFDEPSAGEIAYDAEIEHAWTEMGELVTQEYIKHVSVNIWNGEDNRWHCELLKHPLLEKDEASLLEENNLFDNENLSGSAGPYSWATYDEAAIEAKKKLERFASDFVERYLRRKIRR